MFDRRLDWPTNIHAVGIVPRDRLYDVTVLTYTENAFAHKQFYLRIYSTISRSEGKNKRRTIGVNQ